MCFLMRQWFLHVWSPQEGLRVVKDGMQLTLDLSNSVILSDSTSHLYIKHRAGASPCECAYLKFAEHGDLES